MLPTDRRSEWDGELLNDARVTQLWDADKVSGAYFATEYERRSNWVQWDAYYLFDRGVSWGEAQGNLVGSGRTVIGHSDDLEREISPFLAR